jgi:CubicO group peptidase (beta-lactamase class C family)
VTTIGRCRYLGFAVALGWSCAALGSAPAQPISSAEIDRVVSRVMQEFAVPGLAVGIVKDGRLVFAKGYGVRRVGQPDAVDPDTIFAIGSNTKAFTAAALAVLIDEGKLHWDDRVIDVLPEFRMRDPYVTREFTIRDLLTHRSGLGVGAGDLLFVTPTDYTRRDVLRTLRYLKPATSFRSQFAYDNLLYVVAGEVVRAVSGQSWEDFVTARILKPLQMDACAVVAERLADRSNVASPHRALDGRLTPVPPLEIPVVGPAGSIQCNVTGLANWLATQLGHGEAPGGQRLYSEAQALEMWSPQTILHPSGKRAELTRTHFGAYGLGRGLEDFEGYKRISHNGGLFGMVTHVTMIPELHLGVVVLTNQQEVAALGAVGFSILEAYTGAPKRDWVALTKAMKAEQDERMRESDARRTPPPAAIKLTPADLDSYAGTYEDPWRGEATVSRTSDGLELRFSHTDVLVGPLSPLGNNLFIVRWKDRSLDADAYVRFAQDFAGGVVGFTMQAVSASTDFSFDFQDLDFKRKAGGAPSAH